MNVIDKWSSGLRFGICYSYSMLFLMYSDCSLCYKSKLSPLKLSTYTFNLDLASPNSQRPGKYDIFPHRRSTFLGWFRVRSRKNCRHQAPQKHGGHKQEAMQAVHLVSSWGPKERCWEWQGFAASCQASTHRACPNCRPSSTQLR